MELEKGKSRGRDVDGWINWRGQRGFTIFVDNLREDVDAI